MWGEREWEACLLLLQGVLQLAYLCYRECEERCFTYVTLVACALEDGATTISLARMRQETRRRLAFAASPTLAFGASVRLFSPPVSPPVSPAEAGSAP